jgi:hypothetical protein
VGASRQHTPIPSFYKGDSIWPAPNGITLTVGFEGVEKTW